MTINFIDEINSSDMIVYANKQGTQYVPSNHTPMDGVVRINNGGLEYYNGDYRSWDVLNGTGVQIGNSSRLEEVVRWAYDKMEEERTLDELAKKFPAFKTAKENYELMKAMVKNEMD